MQGGGGPFALHASVVAAQPRDVWPMRGGQWGNIANRCVVAGLPACAHTWGACGLEIKGQRVSVVGTGLGGGI